MNGAIGFAALLLLGLLLALGAAVVFTIHRLRHPPRRTYSAAVARGLPGDPSELDAPRRFEAWTLEATVRTGAGERTVDCPVWEMSGDDPSGPVAVLTPGWGDSRVGGLLRIGALAPHCSRLLLWDPPGQGEAPGKCFLGTAEDQILAALVERAAGPEESAEAVLYGWSLGAGASLVAAGRADIGARVQAVIAEGVYRQPWTPARNVLHEAGYPWRMNVPIAYTLLGVRLGVGPRWRTFDRAAHAARLRAPLLCLHGGDDRICPLNDARATAEAAPEGRLAVIDGAGHNNMWTDPAYAHAAAEAIDAFLQDARSPAKNAAAYG